MYSFWCNCSWNCVLKTEVSSERRSCKRQGSLYLRMFLWVYNVLLSNFIWNIFHLCTHQCHLNLHHVNYRYDVFWGFFTQTLISLQCIEPNFSDTFFDTDVQIAVSHPCIHPVLGSFLLHNAVCLQKQQSHVIMPIKSQNLCSRNSFSHSIKLASLFVHMFISGLKLHTLKLWCVEIITLEGIKILALTMGCHQRSSDGRYSVTLEGHIVCISLKEVVVRVLFTSPAVAHYHKKALVHSYKESLSAAKLGKWQCFMIDSRHSGQKRELRPFISLSREEGMGWRFQFKKKYVPMQEVKGQRP